MLFPTQGMPLAAAPTDAASRPMPESTRSAWLAVVWMAIVVGSYLIVSLRTDIPRLLGQLSGSP
ncbi:MAG TPA: hypothetical protein VHX16_16255 [Chloroflexota bacterium]|nr:hypothetical protein [Chloroflexota bacterium]